MEIRHATHPVHAAVMDTAELREHFLVQDLFVKDALRMVYSYNDRLIVGGCMPGGQVELKVDSAIIGAEYLLERREMGVINVGGKGVVTVDGAEFSVEHKDGLYIGMGSRDVVFASADPENPAKFYFNSAPAHKTYPTTVAKFAEAEPLELGELATSNHRTIRKYIHPDGIQSCQLVMGMTSLETGSVWNTMPTHTHARRMEAYMYFDLGDDNLVFHYMGEPDETRHLVVRQEEAVLSPSWSIHSGSGTSNYTFIWGMAGENQAFGDMDAVPMSTLK